jgi:hypothetical protein
VTFTLQGSSVAQIDGFIAAAYENYREIIKGQKPQAGEEKRWGGCLAAIASWTASLRVSLPACLHGVRFYCACLHAWPFNMKAVTLPCAVLFDRYLYLPVLSGAEGAKETDFTFRCYPLTDGKDFTNFFHPEKDAILQLVSRLLSAH